MPPSQPQAVLLVDGYNVIGAWSVLEKTRDRDGLEAAREQLIEALVNYSAFEGLDTQIVFDAHYQDTTCSCEVISPNLSVCYTDFGQTADTYIEKFCASYRRNVVSARQRVIVATSDRAQQLTVVGFGAEWMSAQRLASEVELTATRRSRSHLTKKQSSSRFLMNSLDAKARERLAEMRKGLK
ncbi:NYN domain-containing protein [Microcoleus sp. FACHB-831]|uniref:NYN domain-containing protein n=1 Tax=Microcoleus sp. FACHB-831 TaxID=2692827 RepID=UPI00168851A0|nr:NYN domain-containing protein [Microcoleus sp. FACHB-831]MBD1924486.1 NYN domain-containing protein [Microcoleus sp. FACHB-831]